MARSRPEKKREEKPRPEQRVLPMQLKVGDRFVDETGEWEVVGRPYTSNAGKNARIRVRRVGESAARRVADLLNRFVGALHAARCTATIWIAHAGDQRFTSAAKYGLQMTFGTTMLTLRKFQDLWSKGQLKPLLEEGSAAWIACEWVAGECEFHKTRDAANKLFAHCRTHDRPAPIRPSDSGSH